MTKRKIAIFLHQPKCSVQSGNGIMKALSSHYTFKIFTKHELEDDFFDDVDMVAFPGGIGDSDSYEYLFRNHANNIRNFVDKGGKYLGVCMGAYWADSDYLNILDNVRVSQYIKQPNTCTRRPHAKAMSVKWNKENYKMFFYDGAVFNGNRNKFETIATYPNGDPMAIIQNNIGLIGCHPESEKHWYEDYSWMPKHWHNNTHGKLLLDFVNKLMEK
jgi:glutamine amidotransferase-like uncharacterized protein